METTGSNVRVTRSGGFDLPSPAYVVFPLFGYDRESDWAQGWRPQPVYPDELRAEDGAVFKTDQNGDVAVWVMTRHELERGIVEYITFRNDDRIGRVMVQVGEGPEGPHGAHVEVTYNFTALSEQGRQHIAHFTEKHYRQMLAHWRQAIVHFLETGNTLQH